MTYNDHEIGDDGTSLTAPRPSLNHLLSLFSKRRVYSHEREIRVVIDYMANLATRNPEEAGVVATEIHVNFETEEPGQQIAVDLDLLVSAIVVSPDYPDWAVGALQDAVYSAGLQIGIEKSSVHQVPIAIPYSAAS